MGLYPIDCRACGTPFWWYSGNNYAQLCPRCQEEAIKKEQEEEPQKPETD